MIKGYLTDKGFEAAVNAQQIYGGHGYIREWGMEQFVRDARIAQIYEGTNGIQALDLVGRKLGSQWRPRHPGLLQAGRRGSRRGQGRRGSSRRVAAALERANNDLQTATLWLMQNGLANPNNAGAAAYPYMTLMGIVCLGLMWLRMAKASSAALANGADNADFHKQQARHRPLLRRPHHAGDATPQRRKIEAGADSIMALPAEAF